MFTTVVFYFACSKMLLVIGDEHKEHLSILNTLSTDGTSGVMEYL